MLNDASKPEKILNLESIEGVLSAQKELAHAMLQHVVLLLKVKNRQTINSS